MGRTGFKGGREGEARNEREGGEERKGEKGR